MWLDGCVAPITGMTNVYKIEHWEDLEQDERILWKWMLNEWGCGQIYPTWVGDQMGGCLVAVLSMVLHKRLVISWLRDWLVKDTTVWSLLVNRMYERPSEYRKSVVSLNDKKLHFLRQNLWTFRNENIKNILIQFWFYTKFVVLWHSTVW